MYMSQTRGNGGEEKLPDNKREKDGKEPDLKGNQSLFGRHPIWVLYD